MNKSNYIFILVGFLIGISCNLALSQGIDPFPKSTFRETSNNYYWKNRSQQSYWQQDVHYTINAKLVADLDLIEGSENLDYYNNSPDTIKIAYFHLYQNAFIKGSYLQDLEKANKVKSKLSEYEQDGKGIEIKNVKQEGIDVESSIDNTILKINLKYPILPNSKTSFQINFTPTVLLLLLPKRKLWSRKWWNLSQ